MNPAHRALRDATSRAHETLDALFGGFDLTNRASYARFLHAHAEAVWPLETLLDLADATRVIGDWDERKRGDLLREDLAFLRDAESAAPPPHEPADLPVAWNDAAIAGVLYVLEGSRLGGRFLARTLPMGFPRAYLDTDQVRGKWPFLLARLDALLYESAALQTAIDAALATFTVFENSGRAWRSEE